MHEEIALNNISLDLASEKIVDRAKSLAEKLIKHNGHDTPPFSPYDYARFLGINEIIKTDLGDLSALVLRSYGGSTIKINKNHSLERQNFSCAHELGHLLLDELCQTNCIQPVEFRSYNPPVHKMAFMRAKERLCDIAATELLMPENIFKKYLCNLGTSISTIEKLANLFKVSLQASAIRTSELSIDPCMILLWKMNPKIQTKTIRLAWHNGPGRKKSMSNSVFPIVTQVNPPSSLHNAYQTEELIKCTKEFRTSNETMRVPMESKGIGRNDNRYVLSLAFLSR
jgi:Zn-dependent peptidase ImmA (M78 family)